MDSIFSHDPGDDASSIADGKLKQIAVAVEKVVVHAVEKAISSHLPANELVALEEAKRVAAQNEARALRIAKESAENELLHAKKLAATLSTELAAVDRIQHKEEALLREQTRLAEISRAQSAMHDERRARADAEKNLQEEAAQRAAAEKRTELSSELLRRDHAQRERALEAQRQALEDELHGTERELALAKGTVEAMRASMPKPIPTFFVYVDARDNDGAILQARLVPV